MGRTAVDPTLLTHSTLPPYLQADLQLLTEAVTGLSTLFLLCWIISATEERSVGPMLETKYLVVSHRSPHPA